MSIVKKGNRLYKKNTVKDFSTTQYESKRARYDNDLPNLTAENVTHLQSITTAEFTLNENITELYPVKIIDNSGPEIQYAGIERATFGTDSVFSASTGKQSCCFDSSNNKVVFAYLNTSSIVYAVVGTVSGTSITFGTPVIVTSGFTSEMVACCFDSNSNKVVIVFNKSTDNYRGHAIVGTVTGNAITFGTSAVFSAGGSSIDYLDCCFDSSNNKVVIVYDDTLDYGFGIVGTVSGTGITYGTAVAFESSASRYMKCCFDSTNNKVVIIFRSLDVSYQGFGIVGTVSGTSITYGTKVSFLASDSGWMDCCFDSVNDKVAVVFRDNTSSNRGRIIAGTVSGTSITFGTAVTFYSTATWEGACTFDVNTGKVVISYRGDSTYGEVALADLNGSTIVLSDPYIYLSDSAAFFSACYDSNLNKSIIGYEDQNDSSNGAAVVCSIDVFDSADYADIAGIITETGTTGQSKRVALMKTYVDGFTGQTPGATAYVQSSGAISETVTSYPIGRFINETTLYITKSP